MKNIFKWLSVAVAGAVLVAAHGAYASFGGLDYARITGPNQVTVRYVHTLDNNAQGSYSNLGMGLTGRLITGVVSTTADSITLSFDGPAVPPNTTGTIDIDNTVTWADAPGGFTGTSNYELSDGQNPSLGAVSLVDEDASGALTAGDSLRFWFNEPMDRSTITVGNVDSYLGLTNGHTFGTSGNGLALSWNATGTILSVTLGTDNTVASGDTASAASMVTDVAGNYNNTPAPIEIPVTAVASRTMYYNDTGNNQDWGDLGNWWDDEAFTVHAASLPNPNDDVVMLNTVSQNTSGSMAFVRSAVVRGGDSSGGLGGYHGFAINLGVSETVSFYDGTALAGYVLGDVSFNETSFSGYPFGGGGFMFSTSMIVGTVSFNAPMTANYGTIIGDTLFHGTYGNAGLIYGNVGFYDTTSNPGLIVGNVEFRDHSFNGGFGLGVIVGNVDVYAPAENPLSGVAPTGYLHYHGYDFDGGTGTAQDPYLISTCVQLQGMSAELSAHYRLTGDVDCSDTSTWNANPDEWVDGIVGGTLIPDSYSDDTHTSVVVTNNGYSGFQPVGDQSTPFTGEFDGQNHQISGLWIFRKTTPFVGLFGMSSGANIHSFTTEGSNIVGGSSTGGIVGYMTGGSASWITNNNAMVRTYLSYNGGGFAGTLDGGDVNFVATSQGAVHGSGNVIGGLIGNMISGNVGPVYSTASVDGGYQIGGLIGSMSGGTVTDAGALGDVASNRSEYIAMKTGYYAGGFVGYMSGGTVTRASASGAVNSTGDYSGGFAGYAQNGTISDSSATGSVSGTEETVNGTTFKPSHMGGFVGGTYETSFFNDSATGSVITTGDNVGGFVGSSQCLAAFANSSASGIVSGANYVGGFVGFDGCQGPASSFARVSASGAVTATGTDAGGFAGGLQYSTVRDAFASGAVTGTSNVGGFAGSIGTTSDISRVYARGAVTGTDPATNAGFVGNDDATSVLADSFWNTETAGQPTNGSPFEKTTAEMIDSGIYSSAGWDFAGVWRSQDGTNDGYPFFIYSLTPEISSVAPVDGSTGVAITAPIVVNFSMPMDTSSVVVSTAPCADGCPAYDSAWSNSDRTLTLTKTGGPFSYSTAYTVSIASGSSANGVSLDPLPYEWSFTTDAAPVPAPQVQPTAGTVTGGSAIGWGSQALRAALIKASVPETMLQEAKKAPEGAKKPGSVKTSRTLRFGMKGDDVKALQKFLNSHGFPVSKAGPGSSGKETGTFSAKTKAALARYQKSKGVKPDGVLGPKTRALTGPF